MTKRLLTATIGIALGLLATAAEARPHEFAPANRDTDWYNSSRHRGDDANTSRSHRRQTAKGSRTRKAANGRRAHQGGKGISGGRASASRTCLTPTARALLGRIEAQFGAMQIISTCRPGARIAGSGRLSRHASGNAIDFNAGARKAAVVRWLIANHKSGGTMTYAGMSHIHVDIGPHFVSLNSRRG